MTTSPPLRSTARSGALLRLFAFIALARVPLAPQAAALTPPQDAVHHSWDLAQAGQGTSGHLIANGKFYYAGSPDYTSPKGIRARDFNGELEFEHLDPQALLYGSSCFGISSDGRIYYFRNTSSGKARCIILNSDGTQLGLFGPQGAESDFGIYGGAYYNGTPIAVSPASGRVYISDQVNVGGDLDPAKKGLVRVFDRDGNHLNDIQTAGVLASTLEGYTTTLRVRVDNDGNDELFAVDFRIVGGQVFENLKVFRGDGGFLRIFSPGDFPRSCSSACLSKGLLLIVEGDRIYAFSPSATKRSDALATILVGGYPQALGFNDRGELMVVNNGALRTYSYPNYATFDSASRDAVPNPWVLGVTQRPGSGIVDIDYRVDDSDDATHTTALIAFADGTASLNNVLQMNTLIEGTAAHIGPARPEGEVQRVTWNAGADWNVDFGTLRVMALARDSRAKWFDVHLVEIPADGIRPAVAIHRTVMNQEDFLVQFLWLVATKDSSVNLVDGVLFGTSGAYDGVILANGINSTPAGRTFLLARDGLRIATAAEVTRAREGATPGYVVSLDPPLQMLRSQASPYEVSPRKINEFGIEVGQGQTGDAQGQWYVVRETTN